MRKSEPESAESAEILWAAQRGISHSRRLTWHRACAPAKNQRVAGEVSGEKNTNKSGREEQHFGARRVERGGCGERGGRNSGWVHATVHSDVHFGHERPQNHRVPAPVPLSAGGFAGGRNRHHEARPASCPCRAGTPGAQGRASCAAVAQGKGPARAAMPQYRNPL